MQPHFSRYLSLTALINFILLICLIRFTRSDDEHFSNCSQPFRCGSIGSLSYPFWGGNRGPYCGLPEFELDCRDNEFPNITISLQKFRILAADTQTHKLTVARADFCGELCSSSFVNTSIDDNHFEFPFAPKNLTFGYGCPPASMFSLGFSEFNCTTNKTPTYVYYSFRMFSPPIGCLSVVNIPILKTPSPEQGLNASIVVGVIHKGFELLWKANNEQCKTCLNSGGQCGTGLKNRFTCFCPDKPSASNCYKWSGSSHQKPKLKITLIVIASLLVGSTIVAVALLYFTRMGSQKLNILSKKERKNSNNVEAVLKRCGEHAQKRYTYKEIKQMTSCFKEKLGEGGYGGVYKGKLQNGSTVAVKLIKNPSHDGTDFINEVVSICETNHVNVVTLLGYCFQGCKRALVFDFMSNGSLDKYIYSAKSQNPLSWETLLHIAIGIGRGLDYLHKGCRTRILHFDIKPHNILLDAKYCPKISDFGLAKQCLESKSLITMSATRGTPGYIAPEVFCRGFGGASHKSDVYSYGMLVLDLVGCRKNSISVSEKTSSEMYFPHWIYKQFELEEDQELLGISNDDEKSLQRKLVIVSLWCIQTHPSNRPSISRAVEMLEEDLDSLEIPPMPFLSSPTKPHSQNLSTCTMTS